MKKLIAWIKGASRTNRPFRTFVQGATGYLVVQVPAVLDGGGDVRVALEALLVGALAAGISAAWKTAEANPTASQEGSRR